MEPPEPMEESLYELGQEEKQKRGIESLPGNLLEAVHELEKDSVVREALGNWSASHLISAKKQEFDEYRIQVSKWEIDKYLETI